MNAETASASLGRAALEPGTWQLQLAPASPQFWHDGETRPLPLRDALMLSWLALEGPTPRERLAQLLWPDSEPAAARNTLRQRLFQLRRQLGVELVEGQAVLALTDRAAHDLADADDLLGGQDAGASGALADWLAGQRERRRRRMQLALAELCEMSERAQDWPGALVHAHELLALEPLSEEAHRRVMRLHYLAGDRAAALLAFDRCEQTLKNEVGAPPSSETLQLLAMIDAAGADPKHAAPTPTALPASVLRPPRLVGRTAAVEALLQGWDAGQVVLVEGEGGLGKSRLLQALAQAHPGALVVAARPGDAGVPLASLTRWVAALHRHDEQAAGRLEAAHRRELAKLLPEMATGPIPAPRGGHDQALPDALEALWRAQAPGFEGLLVDDLQWADEASVEWLGDWILRSPVPSADAPAPRWALASRPAGEASALAALRQELMAHGRLRPLPLVPLDQASLAELVDSLGLPGLNGASAGAALRQHTGGNPMFLLETLKQAWSEHRLAGDVAGWLRARPSSVRAVIAERLARLPAGALALARVAGVAGTDFGVVLAAEVLGRPVIELADDWQALEAAQVLSDESFAHDLVFEAVRDGLSAPIARHLHGRIAAFLEADAAHDHAPARVADHWQAAGQPLRALPWLSRAADAAWRCARRREQLEFLLRRADILADDGQQATAFAEVLGATELHLGIDYDIADGQALCDRLDRLAATDAQRLEAALLRIHLLGHRGDVEQLAVRAEACVAEAQRLGDERLLAQAHGELGSVLVMADRPQDAVPPLRQATEWLLQHGSPTERSVAAGSLAVALDNCGQLDAAMPWHETSIACADQIGDWSQVMSGLSNLACNRIDRGDLRSAGQSVQRALDLAAQHDWIGAQLGTSWALRGLCDLGLGRYSSALQALDEAERVMQREQPALLPVVECHRAACWWQLGQAARAQQALQKVDAGDDTLLVARVRRLLMLSRLARERSGGRDDAAALLAQAVALLPDGNRPDLYWPLVIEQARDLAPADALKRLDEALEATDRLGHGGARLAALVRLAELANGVDSARAAACAREALQQADQLVPATLYLAELWWQAARALQSDGADDEAADVVRRATGWLHDTAQRQVPEAFRSGFLERNPANLGLLAWHARLQHGR
ncbi:MAG TPA: AAA family ATPase [Ideonella sp.]|uniref:ATP-binding protein n=1 Tax=Ideonella sp. TaxID=1929293 RepID=UPI002E2F0ED9|nr:AAA family ATPase [Ideonella sp.]HEX5686080.1 AAA family ATPase [Ideonella sp.]